MIDDLLFADEREHPLIFRPLHRPSSIDSDGAALTVYQLADGELVLADPRSPVISKPDLREQWLAASREELAEPPALLTDALDSLPGKLVHIHAAGGFFGDIALGEELARIIVEREAHEQIFVSSRSLWMLRAFSMDRPQLYFGWHLDEALLGGPVSLELHPLFELLPAARTIALAPMLATEANIEALQQSGHAVGVLAEASPDSACDWMEAP